MNFAISTVQPKRIDSLWNSRTKFKMNGNFAFMDKDNPGVPFKTVFIKINSFRDGHALLYYCSVDHLESEIHEHSDIRSAEFTRLKQDIDQQWNMVIIIILIIIIIIDIIIIIYIIIGQLPFKRKEQWNHRTFGEAGGSIRRSCFARSNKQGPWKYPNVRCMVETFSNRLVPVKQNCICELQLITLFNCRNWTSDSLGGPGANSDQVHSADRLALYAYSLTHSRLAAVHHTKRGSVQNMAIAITVTNVTLLQGSLHQVLSSCRLQWCSLAPSWFHSRFCTLLIFMTKLHNTS